MESFPISLPSFPEMWKTCQHRPRPGGDNPTTPSSGTPSRLPLSGTLISGPHSSLETSPAEGTKGLLQQAGVIIPH